FHPKAVSPLRSATAVQDASRVNTCRSESAHTICCEGSWRGLLFRNFLFRIALAFDGEDQIVGPFSGGILLLRLPQSAVVALVLSDAVKHVALRGAIIFEVFVAEERIFRHFIEKIRR